MSRGSIRALAVLAASALAAACASTPSPGPTATAAATGPRPAPAARVVATPQVLAHERIRRASAFLERGQRELARHELNALMAEHPANLAGKSLLEQLDRDPRALLGERNFAYKVRPGETLPILAERFLGDRMMFYALARYNGIETPQSVVAGRTLLIPGAPKKAAPAPAPRTVAAPAPAPPAAPTANPARASALRRAALENLNKGAVQQAVAQLQQAAPLDPANPLIRSDLDRALRIQSQLKRR